MIFSAPHNGKIAKRMKRQDLKQAHNFLIQQSLATFLRFFAGFLYNDDRLHSRLFNSAPLVYALSAFSHPNPGGT